MKLSVLILSYNESINLPCCIESICFADEVVVLDSGSSDDTVEIATAAGAKVLSRPFDNYANQRNFGLAHDFKHEWVLMLDADERVPEDFHDELRRITEDQSNSVTLYRMRRKDMFMGRWLKRSSGYPTWFGRLFRKGRVRVEREINEEYHTCGEVGMLKGHLLHYPFNKGIAYWFERHNRYSSMEAERILTERWKSILWSDFVSKDPMLRRRAFKRFAYRVPFRPVITFCYLYFFRQGILDGLPGLHFSCMRAVYEYMINLKIKEINRRAKEQNR